MRRADNIRKRLGWEAGILNENGGKPKGMRWALQTINFSASDTSFDGLIPNA